MKNFFSYKEDESNKFINPRPWKRSRIVCTDLKYTHEKYITLLLHNTVFSCSHFIEQLYLQCWVSFKCTIVFSWLLFDRDQNTWLGTQTTKSHITKARVGKHQFLAQVAPVVCPRAHPKTSSSPAPPAWLIRVMRHWRHANSLTAFTSKWAAWGWLRSLISEWAWRRDFQADWHSVSAHLHAQNCSWA